ncbi:MAG: capsular biosynthesis protein [Zymomonas sp.]|nr:capsular biosynthesis protein [Zymomonas sp.]MBA4047208.1 capsular biosynthesis protein [Sphingomonas sp.]
MIDLLAPVALLATALGLIAVDGLARPGMLTAGRPRDVRGLAVLLCAGTALLGAVVAMMGTWLPAAALVVLLAGTLTLVSNIKRDVLGEPLVFTDFALVGAVFRHPQFYLSALRPWHIVVLVLGFAALVAVVLTLATGDVTSRLCGVVLAAGAAMSLKALLAAAAWRPLAENPDLDRDVRAHGLIATLLVYWRHCRHQVPPPPPPSVYPAVAGEADALLIVVQCESFADPQALFGADEPPLPGLAIARSQAWLAGRLAVSGFGAYTMRTEFGVIFGVPEQMLGLQRFDPFLTAGKAAGWALPNRLARGEWTSTFVHPHDMRFYGRDRLMPAAGFDRIVGEDAFPAPAAGEGRYVTDAAVCDWLLAHAASATGRQFVYAVTIENHGPWSAGGAGPAANKAEYLRLLAHSDDLLARLMAELPRLARPVTLCFFGDHRPSIPGISMPGGDRHTPFVIVKFGAQSDAVPPGHRDQTLTPSELQGAILSALASGAGQ